MVLRRHKPHYNDGLLSTDDLDTILREVSTLKADSMLDLIMLGGVVIVSF